MSNIYFNEEAGGIGILTFDKEGSAANIFNSETLKELSAHLDTIEADEELKGLVLISAKESIFIAGADLHEFGKITRTDQAVGVVKLGQDLFSRIEDLKIPTVCCIHGAAVGGGCEIALACDYRIASSERVTRIGLPEINLGILPAWGGSYRLPRLVGLPAALDMILAGKTWVAKKAKKAGLVDQLVPREHFLRIAESWIAKGKREKKSLWKTNNPLVASIASSKASKLLKVKTRGHYPAPLKALQVVISGLSKGRDAAMRLEQKAFAELISGEVSRSLISVFFLQERAKKLGIDGVNPAKLDSLAVIGSGVMGAGIAQWNAAKGSRVLLKDISADALNPGMKSIHGLFATAVKRRAFTKLEASRAIDRISPVAYDVPMQQVDLVIEAATENMELKKNIFSRLDQLSSDKTILATNTSALSINEIANAVSDPSRVIGIHYFNPVAKMQLVEVVVGPRTAPEVTAAVIRFIQASGKMPVKVKDSPGFLVNRILMPYLIEAGHLFENGAAPETLDRVMLDFGMPMGPCRLIDEIGADVACHVAEFFAGVYGARMPFPRVLREMVDRGMLGRKSGQGFYIYEKDKEPISNPEMQCLVDNMQYAHVDSRSLEQRMVYLMVNEAAMCISEGVVEAPEDVDFGMIMGTGFAPFLGGPCRYADGVGLDNIASALTSLAKNAALRFKPCAYLAERAEKKAGFYAN